MEEEDEEEEEEDFRQIAWIVSQNSCSFSL